MKPLALIAVLTLTGCGLTPQGDMVREFARDRAQKAADQSAVNALAYLCTYARVGSISKLLQDKQDRLAYKTLCRTLPPVVPDIVKGAVRALVP